MPQVARGNCVAEPPAYPHVDLSRNSAGFALTIGASLFLIAFGAILKFAVTWTPAGINLHITGLVLMIVGAIGLVVGLVVLFSNRSPGVGPPPPSAGVGPPPPAP